VMRPASTGPPCPPAAPAEAWSCPDYVEIHIVMVTPGSGQLPEVCNRMPRSRISNQMIRRNVMSGTPKKPKTSKKKVQSRDLEAMDSAKIKGGMNKAALIDAVASKAGLTKADARK
jgi:hypothetical protein